MTTSERIRLAEEWKLKWIVRGMVDIGNDMETQLRADEEEIARLTAALAECCRRSGADPSGGMKGDVDEDWRPALRAVDAVGEMRADYDEACEIADRHRAKLAEAENVIREVERHCPCGARPETLITHPHMPGCPIGKWVDAAIDSPRENANGSR